MSTDWSLDFCIVCDRQTLGGAYCSQACRLAEIDQYSSLESEPSSPTSTTGPNRPWADDVHNHRSCTPFSFAATKAPSVQTTFSSISSIFSKPSSRVSLTPSASQTSLSSLSSSSSIVTVSGRAKTELDEYAGCFDQAPAAGLVADPIDKPTIRPFA
ncbi:predicted protein [Uncinocarpus reesii 1704]|uniref:Uncharacterized protein n=1 Tax=Uncinocarpus reesii (strain UAMH 1704) TaxID=336963 RepID=C4JTB1_UNCRE|nr:uncharacterized protein UREG_05700 [Uncinocarpus reesii 1704]EEP80858.1 predicted protein [Uncinocarpus reesii 1704]